MAANPTLSREFTWVYLYLARVPAYAVEALILCTSFMHDLQHTYYVIYLLKMQFYGMHGLLRYFTTHCVLPNITRHRKCGIMSQESRVSLVCADVYAQHPALNLSHGEMN